MSEESNQAVQETSLSKDDTNMGMIIHLLLLFTGFVGPLIIWLLKKDESKYIDEQGKEALNFCITMFLAFVACQILMFVLIGMILLPLVILYALIIVIVAVVKTSKGENFRYPLTLRLLK